MAIQDKRQVFGCGAIGTEGFRAFCVLGVKYRIFSIHYCGSIDHAEPKHLLSGDLELRAGVDATANIWGGETVDVLEGHPGLRRNCGIECETLCGCTSLHNNLGIAVHVGMQFSLPAKTCNCRRCAPCRSIDIVPSRAHASLPVDATCDGDHGALLAHD